MTEGGRVFSRNFPQALLAATMVAVALLSGTPLRAAEPSITVEGGAALSNYQTYVDQINSLIRSDAALASSGAGSGMTHYFDLRRPLADVPGFADMAAADKALIQGAKRTYDLFVALGGKPTDRFGVAETRDGLYYLALDGEGGRWVSSPEEALSALVQQLAGARLTITREGEKALPCPFDFRCLLTAAYEGDVKTLAYVPRDTTVTLVMTGNGFLNAGGPPVLIVPPGMIVHDVTFIDSETISARVSIAGTAELGVNVLAVFNEGSKFRPNERYGLQVVGGIDDLNALIEGSTGTKVAGADSTATASATQPQTKESIPVLAGTGGSETLTDDFGGQASSAGELLTQVSGRLEQSGDVDLFRIVVDTAGRLILSSEGPTDVSGVLEDANGNVIAADDDGAGKYNFALDTPVTAGVYYLRVGHCCQGGGTYRISKSFQPN